VKAGTLIAFEGGDGSGKTTQLARAAATLRAAGCDVLTTSEPTQGVHGRLIRKMARSGDHLPPVEELSWFIRDRREHVSELIAPALAAGRIVLTDRYTLSSVAYQGARGIDPHEILRDAEEAFPLPQLALVFEVDPAVGLERVRKRGSVAEPVFEEQKLQERVAAIFASLDRPYIARVDGSRDIKTVEAEVTALLRTRLDLP
jgi:dTMP kinase